MTQPLNTKKYEEVIVYLCQKLGGEIRGKKKLAKLLYFADFDFYEKNQVSITGDLYKALPMGPFPVSLDATAEKMVHESILTIAKVEDHPGYFPTEVYSVTGSHEVVLLNEDEKKMLDRIAVKYGNLSGKQLEDLSHAEAPYIATEPLQEIPYELSFYRGTDFNDL